MSSATIHFTCPASTFHQPPSDISPKHPRRQDTITHTITHYHNTEDKLITLHSKTSPNFFRHLPLPLALALALALTLALPLALLPPPPPLQRLSYTNVYLLAIKYRHTLLLFFLCACLAEAQPSFIVTSALAQCFLQISPSLLTVYSPGPLV